MGRSSGIGNQRVEQSDGSENFEQCIEYTWTSAIEEASNDYEMVDINEPRHVFGLENFR